jgi:hypothetical protein
MITYINLLLINQDILNVNLVIIIRIGKSQFFFHQL